MAVIIKTAMVGAGCVLFVELDVVICRSETFLALKVKFNDHIQRLNTIISCFHGVNKCYIYKPKVKLKSMAQINA